MNTVDNDPSGVTVPDEKTRFNLQLNDLDRLGGIIFGVGLNFLFIATDESEQAILLEQDKNLPVQIDAQLNHDIAKKLADANWLFLLGETILLNTATERLKQLEGTLDPNSPANRERLYGRELVVTGDMFKILGFVLTAKGFELIADSTLREQQETPVP